MNPKEKKSYNTEFATRLHQALDHKGYDRFKRTRLIADKLKLTTSPVSKWLNGHTVPLPKRMEELCDAFEINSAFLIDGAGPIDKDQDSLDINVDLLNECVAACIKALDGESHEKIASVVAEIYQISSVKNSVDTEALNRLVKLIK